MRPCTVSRVSRCLFCNLSRTNSLVRSHGRSGQCEHRAPADRRDPAAPRVGACGSRPVRSAREPPRLQQNSYPEPDSSGFTMKASNQLHLQLRNGTYHLVSCHVLKLPPSLTLSAGRCQVAFHRYLSNTARKAPVRRIIAGFAGGACRGASTISFSSFSSVSSWRNGSRSGLNPPRRRFKRTNPPGASGRASTPLEICCAKNRFRW